MSTPIPPALYPVLVCEDRYCGTYSGGAWWAVAEADRPFEGRSRIVWLWEHGPGSDDVTASVFWSEHPAWIAVGATPDQAIQRLLAQPGNDRDEWSSPPVERDPRYGAIFDS
jgi:hypothetical protein